MPLPDLGALALVALVALLVAGALSPIETLGWWAGWYGDTIDELEADPARAAPGEAEGDDAPPRRRVDPWVVFLTGIHAVDHVTFDRAEARLVARLRRARPGGRVVEVFPNSGTIRAVRGEGGKVPADVLFPTVHDGVEGVAFVEACVRSSKENGAWTKL